MAKNLFNDLVSPKSLFDGEASTLIEDWNDALSAGKYYKDGATGNTPPGFNNFERGVVWDFKIGSDFIKMQQVYDGGSGALAVRRFHSPTSTWSEWTIYDSAPEPSWAQSLLFVEGAREGSLGNTTPHQFTETFTPDAVGDYILKYSVSAVTSTGWYSVGTSAGGADVVPITLAADRLTPAVLEREYLLEITEDLVGTELHITAGAGGGSVITDPKFSIRSVSTLTPEYIDEDFNTYTPVANIGELEAVLQGKLHAAHEGGNADLSSKGNDAAWVGNGLTPAPIVDGAMRFLDNDSRLTLDTNGSGSSVYVYAAVNLTNTVSGSVFGGSSATFIPIAHSTTNGADVSRVDGVSGQPFIIDGLVDIDSRTDAFAALSTDGFNKIEVPNLTSGTSLTIGDHQTNNTFSFIGDLRRVVILNAEPDASQLHVIRSYLEYGFTDIPTSSNTLSITQEDSSQLAVSVYNWQDGVDVRGNRFKVTDDPSATVGITEVTVKEGTTKSLYLIGPAVTPTGALWGGRFNVGTQIDVTNTGGVFSYQVGPRQFSASGGQTITSYLDFSFDQLPQTASSVDTVDFDYLFTAKITQIKAEDIDWSGVPQFDTKLAAQIALEKGSVFIKESFVHVRPDTGGLNAVPTLVPASNDVITNGFFDERNGAFQQQGQTRNNPVREIQILVESVPYPTITDLAVDFNGAVQAEAPQIITDDLGGGLYTHLIHSFTVPDGTFDNFRIQGSLSVSGTRSGNGAGALIFAE